ncbi:ATP-binding protein, partial [Aduncisulcus paluster]
ADNGTGFKINPEDALKPFISGKQNGMGLGLHLAQEIMKMSNGIISVRNPVEFDLPQPQFETGAVVALTFMLEGN